jgi:hypothetical protein
VYQAQLLENAEMNLKQKKEYEIIGAQVYDYLVGTYNENEVRESIEVIVSTKNMPREKMIEAQLWSWFMNTFHINGITNYISRYLVKKYDIDYPAFYEKFRSFIENNEWLKKELDTIELHYRKWTTNGKIDYPPVAGVEMHGWNIIHSTLIKIHLEQKRDEIFDLVETFVRQNFPMQDEELCQLMDFQKNYLINYNVLAEYPKQKTYDYDFLGYLVEGKDINNSVVYQFDFPEDKRMTLQRFCENVFYARRRNFGKAWITTNSGQK